MYKKIKIVSRKPNTCCVNFFLLIKSYILVDCHFTAAANVNPEKKYRKCKKKLKPSS